MTSISDLLFDTWTPVSFKRAVGDAGSRPGGRAWAPPTWVGDHGRRLQAYKILQSYVDNASRHFLEVASDKERAEHREYGDAALLVAQIRSSLVGESQTISVEGSEQEQEEQGRQGEQEQPGEEDAPPGPLTLLEEWARDWATAERLPLKMLDVEKDVVSLGDGVYALGWSSRKRRPRLRVYDPGFYFPVLDDDTEEFPTKIHLAWELPPETEGPRAGQVRVRRITYELLPLPEGETRTHPWNDEPAEQTCHLTDGIFLLDSGTRPFDVDATAAAESYARNEDGEELRALDLNIDFIPVIHIPNTVAEDEHFGRSVLASVLQIIDDLANADTDLQAASATTGTPPVALSGASMGPDDLVYRPGTVWQIGEGRMDVLDTSRALDALLKYVEALLDRLSVNARIPAGLLGRIDPSDVPSGIALQLSFGPLRSLVEEMRLIRQEKYELLFRFAWRLALAGGAPQTPATYAPTRLVFGSFLPADQAEAVTMASTLLNAKAISTETAVMILQAAGLPIEEASKEVERIHQQDFEGANALLDATGNADAVAEYLGIEVTAPAPPPLPPINLPPPPPEEEV